ncbi:MAG: hypothetical protein KIT81_10385 [Alphaproteobacteria bacterium]|nr:hypothetical protein [Alphaproteobacteria bacterium]
MSNIPGIVGMATLAIAALSFNANAAPIGLSGGFSTGDLGVSGELHGDLSGGVLLLNSTAPTSSLTIDLADPPSVPLQNQNVGDNCQVYRCTVRMFPNGSTSITFPPWEFAVGGVVDFNAGTASLTADPTSQTAATDHTVMNPTFTVVADQDYGPINQALANAEAATIQAGLNNAGATLTVKGTGIWDTVDLGTIAAALQQGPDETTARLLLENSTFIWFYDFEVDLEFATSVVGLVGSAFEGFLERTAEAALRDALVNLLSISYSNEFGQLRCREGRPHPSATRIEVVCETEMELALTGPGLSAPSQVDEPSSLGLLALGLALLGYAGRSLSARRRR